MLTNFVFIIIAIIVYSVQFPGTSPSYSPYFYPIGFSFFFFLYAYLIFRFFKKRLRVLGDIRTFSPWFKGQYQLHLNRLMFLAIAFYAFLLYFVDLKGILESVPTETLRSILGIAPFFLFLVVLWFYAFPLHQRLFQTSFSRLVYVLSQLRFNFPVILPWLIATLCLDLAFLLPPQIQNAIVVHEWTQLILYSVFFLFLGIFFPVIIKSIWGCKAINDPELLDLMASLCAKAGVKIRNAVMWPVMETQVITAGVMGLASRYRYILLTPAITQILSREELESVLAHELGHTKKRHMHFFLLFFMGYAILSFLYPDIFFWFLYLSGMIEKFPHFFISGDSKIISLLFVVPLVLLLFLYFRYLFGFFSRNFEREADLFSLSLMGRSAPLVSALEKVAFANGIDRNAPNWHHYGIKQRVDFLRDCESRKYLISGHGKKVVFCKLFYLLGLVFLAGFLTFSMKNPPHEAIKLTLIENGIIEALQKKKNDSDMHLLLGNVRVEKKDFRGAIEAYENTLQVDPMNVSALNNLAWLLATSEDKGLRNYKKALRLAKTAITVEKKPYILDTLAECYFVNGQREKAIKVEEDALEMVEGDKSHYRKQIERFRKKLRVK